MTVVQGILGFPSDHEPQTQIRVIRGLSVFILDRYFK
jgi:hypothetical protein